ncbi:enoyl-CoA hydratase/isomerase family protein [Bacillus sp. FSL W7-1360]
MTNNVIIEKTNTGVGRITLAREKALNALSYDMIESMLTTLKSWHHDPDVHIIILEGAGEKAFCAGGDIKTLYQAREHENGIAAAKQFFTLEYELDLLIATFEKPIIALLDGIVMGGGVGLSYGASHRIVTDQTKWSMPEMNISFFPDVGACHFLNQSPGYAGRYAALTAAVVRGEDAMLLGAADHYVKADVLSKLKETLLAYDWIHTPNPENDVDELISIHETAPTESKLSKWQSEIDQHFSHETIEGIIHSLEASDTDFAKETANTLRQLSPLSLKVTLAHLQQSVHTTLKETYANDIQLALQFLTCPDFYEGVRAVLIDKTRQPTYQYENVEAVPDKAIVPFFATNEVR